MPLANVLVETFLKGGPIMWPILVCLIVALATVAERLLYWRNVRRLRADKAFAEALWEVRLGQYGPAWQRTQGATSPFLIALRSGLANGRTEPVTAMQLRAEETLEDAGARQWLLSTIVTLAPLLGLLGTVVGIMGSFQFIGSEQLAVAKVSGGVGEALIATAAGLGIAIFCLIPHNFFHRRAQSLRHDLEQAINQAEIALKSAAAAGQPVSEFNPRPTKPGAVAEMAVRLRRPKEEETGARIEIVPLIDIMFFLLATFILATLGMTQSQALAPVRLPTSGAATASAERNLIVAVDAAGTLSLDGRALGRNELVAELRRRAAAAPGRPALVQGDARTPFAAMTRALEAVGEAGITEVRFAAEPVESR